MDKKPIAKNVKKFPNNNPGLEVKPGQNFATISQAERDAYFRNHEHRWKSRYNANAGTVQARQNFTRGG